MDSIPVVVQFANIYKRSERTNGYPDHPDSIVRAHRDTPIVVLHGWGLQSTKYNHLKSSLLKYFREVHLLDLPGFGEAARPTIPYTLTEYAKVVNDYLSKNKIKETIIIGHSFGGRVGIKFANIYPNKIKKLILTGVPGIRDSSAKRIVFRFVAKIGNIVFGTGPLTVIAPVARKLLYRLSGSYDYLKTNNNMRQTFLHIVEEDLAPLMRKITPPTLLIWGENDKHTPVWIAHRMKNLIPQSSLIVVDNTDHSLPYKNPEIFVKYIVTPYS